MLVDVNTYIGHWPFRRLRHNTAEALVRRLDAHDIDWAVVASIHGIFHKNIQPADEELSEETEPYRNRLLPFATLNPNYPGWEEDLRRCTGDLGLRGLQLYPQYHGYRLTNPSSLELIDAATALGWAVQVPMRVVDRRQRHSWDVAADIPPADFETVFRRCSRTRWMVLNESGLDGARLPADVQFLIEILRLTVVLQRTIPALLNTAGPQHLAFGTGMPFKVADPALLKLDILEAPKEIEDRIAWQNVAEMLELKL